MSKKRSKVNFIFLTRQKFKNVKECERVLYQNPATLDKYFIGCDFGITGEDKTVEYFVKRDETKVIISPISDNVYANIVEACRNFSNSLNELKKQKAMKITEETKIKELIPEGYEFDSAFEFDKPETFINGKPNKIGLLTIPIKKKEVKDFDWYYRKYLSNFNSPELFDRDLILHDFKLKNYVVIPFEFKIGLLNFICDDIDTSLIDTLFEIKKQNKGFRVASICPPEFLKSIFK